MQYVVVDKIKKEIIRKSDSRYVERWGTNSDGARVWLGVKRTDVRQISKKYFKEVQELPKRELVLICEHLLTLKYREYGIIAFDWFHRLSDKYSKSDFKILQKWVKNYLDDWDDCDDLCTHALGEYLVKFPSQLSEVFKWTKSKKWVVRRAAAVSLIYGLRRGDFSRAALETATALLKDPHYLVQKGYGWMLKEAVHYYESTVFDFIMNNKNVMPRVSLRYAIEKMSPTKRKKAMAK